MDGTACNDIRYLKEMPVTVRYGEVGANGFATLSSLGNWLQEAAGLSADELGFGAGALSPYGLTWILMRMILHIERLPSLEESLVIATWPSRFSHFGYRGYKIFDSERRCIVHGGSAWSVMDLAARSLSSLPEELTARYPEAPSGCDEFSCRAIPKMRSAECTSRIRVRKDDLDINGHVNNTKYLAWIMEKLPFAQAVFPRMVDISFRAECLPEDELDASCMVADHGEIAPAMPEGPPAVKYVLHSVTRISDNSNVCRALSAWSA
ncbi:MAG: acyl-[acyl-carrier-protein] thioesterase [Desulfovibrio sp.]|nr:acyl-ACP thioesterase [Mailhella sp.]